MDAKNPEIEELHRKAAKFYLQGDFKAALATWNELLAIDRGDHRALEGARLCQMLFDDTLSIGNPVSPAADPAPALPQQAQPVQPGGAAPVFGGADLDELDHLMEANGDEIAWDANADASVPLPLATEEGAAASADDQSFDFDFSVPGDAEAAVPQQVPSEPPPLPAGTPGPPPLPEAGNPGPLGSEAAPAVAAATVDAVAGDPAAAELQKRLNQLLNEASTAYDSGDKDLALGTISRIFILDDDNAAAADLQLKIMQEIDAEKVALAAAGASADELPEAAAEATAAPAVAAAAQGDPVDLDLELGLEPDAPADSEGSEIPALEGQAGASAPAKADPLARFGGSRKIAMAASLFVLLGTGAFIGLKLMGSRGSEPEPVAAAAPGSKGAGGAAGVADTRAPAEPAPDLALEPAPQRSPEEIQALLSGARDAADAGDHTQAIIGFNQVLESDPGNKEAAAGLERSGNEYRKTLAVLKQKEEAVLAFNGGNYRRALGLFYRVPGADGDPQYDRYKAKGWYNLGVQAIQAGDCKRALSSFREIREFLPDDPAASQAISLARACRSPDKPIGYAAKVAALSIRALED